MMSLLLSITYSLFPIKYIIVIYEHTSLKYKIYTERKEIEPI